MKLAIIGGNSMLSVALTKYFFNKENVTVDVYRLEEP